MVLLLAGCALPALAHGDKVGALRIEHPYAMPTPPGATQGAAYLRAIRNTGVEPDRLLGARTPVARAVEIHRSAVDAQQVMRMRPSDGIDLPTGAEVRIRHGGQFHLMLVDLNRPLKDGDRFPMTLQFQKAGKREVIVWVQTPRGTADEGPHQHKH